MSQEGKNKPLVKQSGLRIFIFFIVFFILTGLFTYSIALILDVDITNAELESSIFSNFKTAIIFSIANFLAMFLSVIIMRKYFDRKSIKSMGFNIKHRKKDMLLGFLSGFALIISGFLFLYISSNIEIISVEYNISTLTLGIILFAIAGFNEEIMFRGYILNNLMESMNKYHALLISAIIFALVHGLNPNINFIALLNIFLAGILLGISYIYTKNLWFPTFLHLSWNYFQGPVFGFEVSGLGTDSIIKQNNIGIELLTGGEFGFEGSVISTVVIIIAIVIINQFYLRALKK